MSEAALDLLSHPAMFKLHIPEIEETAAPTWSCSELSGRLCELSSGRAAASLSAAFGLVLGAQLAGEPVAWVSATAATFYPPDVADGGVDLASLIVVRAPGARAAGRAADVLLRSGAYGLVVIDLGPNNVLPIPLQGRLVQLALKHNTAVLCLTEKSPDDASLGSLVSLRGQSKRQRNKNGFTCDVQIMKDKRCGPGWRHQESCRGPEGLH